MPEIENKYITIDNEDGSSLSILQFDVYLTTDKEGRHYLVNIHTDRPLIVLDDASFAQLKLILGI